MTKFMSWKWIVKKDDFAHWYTEGETLTRDALAPVVTSAGNVVTSAGNAMTCPTQPCPTQPNCGQPCPTWLGGNDAEAQLPQDYTEQTTQPAQDEQHILNHLRSSPSLVRAFSTTSAVSANAANVAKADEGSTSSKTQANSVDGEEPAEKQGYSRRFLLFSALACCLFIVLIVLLALFLVDRRRNFRLDGDTPATGLDTNTTENSTSLLDSETSYPVYDDAYLNSLFGEEEAAEEDVLKFDYTANSDYLVGAYYYPWYGQDFHRGENYMRAGLIPAQGPVLGEYDDTDPEVIQQHMAWFRQSNIGLLVTSWWGPYTREDNTTKNVIMEHEDVGNLKIALHYETKGRIENYTDTSMIRSDIQHMCENYFDHSNYYSIDGRPVIVIHITRSLFREDQMEKVIAIMRSEAGSCDKNVYVIGDHAFRSAPDEVPYDPFRYLDAVTNFDVYGSSGKPDGFVGTDGVDQYYSQQLEWKEAALNEDCHYIPPVSPGYNNRLENDDPAMLRRLTPDAEEGSLFWYQLKQALPLVSSEVDNMILVNSFNQFHEDTQIEPVMSAVPAGIITNRPPFLTGGYEYSAYGELYLDLLRAATSNDPEERVFFDELYLV